MRLRPYTEKEWGELPHVLFTSEEDWDPSTLDLDIDNDELWYDAITDNHEYPINQRFDEYGNYRHRVEVQAASIEDIDNSVDKCVIYHTYKHRQGVIGNDHDTSEQNDDILFSMNLDDSLYYTGDHYSETDNVSYYESYEALIYNSFNADTSKDKIDSL